MIKPNTDELESLKNDSTKQLFDRYFPPDSPFLQRPENASNLDWNNHMYSLHSLICNIKFFFLPYQSLTNIILQHLPELEWKKWSGEIRPKDDGTSLKHVIVSRLVKNGIN